MIFRSFDTGLDGAINKIGIFKKSFADISVAFENGGLKGLRNVFSNVITNDDIKNIEKYNQLLSQGVSGQSAYYQSMLSSSDAAKELVASQKGAIISTETLEAAQNRLTIAQHAGAVATKVLIAAANVLTFIAIAKLIEVVISAFKEFAERVSAARDAIIDFNKDFENSTKELEVLDEQINETISRIKELEETVKNGNLSLSQEEELNRLRETNAELQEKSRILKEQQYLAAKEAADDAYTSSTAHVASKYKVETITTYNTSSSGADPSKRTTTTSQSMMVTAADELRYATEAAANYTAQIDDLNQKMTDGEITEEEYNSQIIELRKNQTEARNVAQEMYKVVSADVEAYQNATDAGVKLSDAQDDQKIACEEALVIYDAYMVSLHKVGDVQTDATNAIEENAVTYEKLATKYDSLKESADDLRSSLSNLTSAFAEQAEHGSISMDTMMKLVEAGYASALAFDAETGACTINAEAMKSVVQQKLSALLIDMQSLQTDIATKLTSDGAAAYESANGFYDLAAAKKANLEADIQTAMANYNSMKGQMISLKDYAKNWGSVLAGTYSSSFSSVSKKAETDYKALLDKEIAAQEAAFNAGLLDYKVYLNNRRQLAEKYYREGKISAADYYDSLKETQEAQLEIYKKVLSAVQRRFDKEIEKINETIEGIERENKLLEKQKERYDAVLSVVESVFDSRIETLKAEQDAIQENIDAINDENEANEKALALEEARRKLAEVRANRTKLIYTEENGFIYTNNEEEVKQVEQEVADLESEQLVDQLESEKEKLQEIIDQLEKYKDKWAEIPDLHQKAVNQQIAIEILGAEYEKLILSGRIEDIQAFADVYIATQQKIDDNTSLIESNEQKIEEYERLKDQWSQVAEEYIESVENQYAAMLLGQNWEAEVLDGRIDKLNDFRNSYRAIQEDIARLAWESANAQIEAAKAAQSGAGGSTNEDFKLPTSSPNSKYYSSFNKIQQFAKGGVLSGNTSSALDYFAQRLGEDKMYAGKVGERILTVDQNGAFETLIGLAPELIDSTRYLKSVLLPNKNSFIAEKQSGLTYGDINITMNGVNDTMTFARVLKQQLPGILSQIG